MFMEFIEDKIPVINSKKIKLLSSKDILYFSNLYYDFNPDYYFKIKREIFHKKHVDCFYATNELLGKLISEFFKDNQPETYILRNQLNDHFLLTKNFLRKGYYYTALYEKVFPKIRRNETARLSLFNLDLLDEFIFRNNRQKLDRKNISELQYKLKSMIINDFMRNQCDSWYYNFLIEYNETNCSLVPLFDFEHSFLMGGDEDLYNSFYFNLNDNNVVNYIRNDIQFQEIINKALELNMKMIFEKLFDEYPIRMNSDEILVYSNIVENKKQEIKRYNLIK